MQDQIRVLRLHAKHMRWKVIKTFIDQSISGARIAKGPAQVWQPYGELWLSLKTSRFCTDHPGCATWMLAWFDAIHPALAVFI